MSKHYFTLSIVVAGVECEFDAVAEYDYYPNEKGTWCDGVQMEPDYPESADIYEVYIDMAKEPNIYLGKVLTKAQYAALEQDILASEYDNH